MWAYYSKFEGVKLLLFSDWRNLLFLPFLNLALIVLFWQSQILQYTHSTKGVLYMWLVAGLLFLLLQLSLLFSGWQRINNEKDPTNHLKARLLLASQIGLFIIAAIYNSFALIQLSLLGVTPTTPYDLVIMVVLLLTAVTGLVLYKKDFAKPKARLLYATGTKAVPQWLQAIGFAVLGSSGMHVLTLTAITAMGTVRFYLAKQSAITLKDDTTSAAHSGAFRDLISILAMGLGWIIGRLN